MGSALHNREYNKGFIMNSAILLLGLMCAGATISQEFGSEVPPSGYGSDRSGFGSEMPSGYGSDRSDMPSEMPSEMPSDRSEMPSGDGSEMPSGDGSNRSGFDSEMPSGDGSEYYMGLDYFMGSDYYDMGPDDDMGSDYFMVPDYLMGSDYDMGYDYMSSGDGSEMPSLRSVSFNNCKGKTNGDACKKKCTGPTCDKAKCWEGNCWVGRKYQILARAGNKQRKATDTAFNNCKGKKDGDSCTKKCTKPACKGCNY